MNWNHIMIREFDYITMRDYVFMNYTFVLDIFLLMLRQNLTLIDRNI